MNSFIKSTSIQIPLTIGLSELQSHHRQLTVIDQSQFELKADFKNDLQFKSFLLPSSKQPSFTCGYTLSQPNELILTDQKNEDLLQLNEQQSKQTNDFYIYKQSHTVQDNSSISEQDHSIEPKFKYSFTLHTSLSPQPKHSNKKIVINLIQQNIIFELTKITHTAKFVRNSLLTAILNQESTQKEGLLTMDQSKRILVEKSNMNFPVIGFWTLHDNRKSQSLNNIQTYERLSQFIKRKYEKKCIFTTKQNENKYFYFVSMSLQTHKIDTYLVSYEERAPISKQFVFPFTSKQIKFSSKSFSDYSLQRNQISPPHSMISANSKSSSQSPQNGMDFTLLEQPQQKPLSTLQSLMNHSYLSPIKQLHPSSHQQNIDITQSQSSETQHLQNSPQFSTLAKLQPHTPTELQCQQLKKRVKSQQEQITKLKQIIIEMQSQLKLYKNSRLSTNCETNRKLSHGVSSSSSGQFAMTSSQPGDMSPQDIRRLRASDLKTNSLSDLKSNNLSDVKSSNLLLLDIKSNNILSQSQRQNPFKNISSKKYLINTLSNNKSHSSSNSSKEVNSSASLQTKNSSENLNEVVPMSIEKVILPSKVEKFNCDDKLYTQLPQIQEQDTRDPWDYMEIIED